MTKNKVSDKDEFVASGKKNYERTKEFRRKKYRIIQEINEQFAPQIASEQNVFRKVRLILKRRRTIRKELEILRSKEILFIDSK